MYWGNNKKKYNNIVHPDHWMFLNYSKNSPIYLFTCSKDNEVKWEDKEEKVYFKGVLSGKLWETDD